MSISEIAIKRPVFTTMITLGWVVLGFLGFSRLGTDLYPDVKFPFVTIAVPYPGAAPEDVRRWRPGVVRGAEHEYVVRRAIADAVGSSLLRLSLHDLPDQLAAVRAAISSGEHAEAASEDTADEPDPQSPDPG